MKKIISNPVREDELQVLKDAGCDMVIIGDKFNGTRMPHYFEREDIIHMVNSAHRIGLEVIIALNRMYTDEDINELEAYLNFLEPLNIDYYYYQDQGVFSVMKRRGLENKLIYNPDTLCANSNDIKVMESLGVFGCFLAKELTLEQMCTIAKKTKNSMVIVHGYLNMSYSKRLLLDNYMRVINKPNNLQNRYDLKLKEDTRDDFMPVYEDEQGTSIYTPYIQESFAEIKKLADSNVSYFFVDRIFNDLVFTCDAIKGYHAILNGEDAQVIKQAYYDKYHDYPLSTGYMYQKTRMVKGE